MLKHVVTAVVIALVIQTARCAMEPPAGVPRNVAIGELLRTPRPLTARPSHFAARWSTGSAFSAWARIELARQTDRSSSCSGCQQPRLSGNRQRLQACSGWPRRSARIKRRWCWRNERRDCSYQAGLRLASATPSLVGSVAAGDALFQ